jgi:acetyl/propionyl-CoA carboxylase alpha subunit
MQLNQIGLSGTSKASVGGGGKGMRIVHDPKDLESQRTVDRAKHKVRLVTARCHREICNRKTRSYRDTADSR